MVMICRTEKGAGEGGANRDDEESDRIIFSGGDSAGSLDKNITWQGGERGRRYNSAAPAVKEPRGTRWQMSISVARTNDCVFVSSQFGSKNSICPHDYL